MRKIIGYKVTDSDENKTSELMGFEKAVRLANKESYRYFNHIDRYYDDGLKIYILMVTRASLSRCVQQYTINEQRVMRKVAKELGLEDENVFTQD